MKTIFQWTIILPLISTVFYFMGWINHGVAMNIIGAILLIVCVLSAVHHAEIVAHKIGEPFGTIILALSITIIEVALIISLMIAGGNKAMALARDTVFAAIMLILNGILGICIWIGDVKFHEQFFARSSDTTSLVSLVAILVFTLILPNYTTSENGPFYTESQLIFVSISCLIIYGTFLIPNYALKRN